MEQVEPQLMLNEKINRLVVIAQTKINAQILLKISAKSNDVSFFCTFVEIIWNYTQFKNL